MRKYFPLFLMVFFLVLGCSKKSAPLFGMYEGGLVSESSSVYLGGKPGLGYDDSAPLFYDMSNLYGRTADENTGSAATSRSNANEPEYIAENVERKIVRRANVRVRVDNLETAEISINELMEKYGAYAASTSADENSRRYIIRVPSIAYKEFLAGTAGMGKLLSRSENAEDVSLRYYDLEGRLATNKEVLKTYQSYLGKAKTIEEILSVERRIAELQSEIDRTGRDLRGLANDVDYSTVELSIFGPAASISYQYPTLSDRIKELFGGFGNFLSVLAVILIGVAVYGVPIALLLAFFFWLLFGKIGLLKKIWRLAAGRKKAGEDIPHE
jgi:hypothetical protein